MQFLFQPLTWGFLLVLAPVLIHLINMMRQQRVRWAAMEFLLKSYKKHRRWVWLKQLLLLLARMAAIALAVLMLAQWLPQGGWLDQLGGGVTHHIVLLDDSSSMMQQGDDLTSFEAGWRAVARLGEMVSEDRRSRHRFTLLRLSRAQRGLPADLGDAVVDREFSAALEQVHQRIGPSYLACDPQPALQAAARLVQQQPDAEHRIYLVTDLRRNQWESPAELKQELRALYEAGAELQVIGCQREEVGNLAVVSVTPDSGARAAGVPLFVNIRIKNLGEEIAKRVQLEVETLAFPSAADAAPGKAQPAEQVETVEIAQVAPGETVTQRVQVYFANAGQHVVRVSTPDDASPADNTRSCVVDIQPQEQILIIDGDPNRRNAFFLDAIFRPGGRAETGVAPVEQSPEFLRDAGDDDLAAFATIVLCDVPTLDSKAIANLEGYAERGGGVAFFVGENVSMEFYRNQLYREGQGLFPAPLARDAMLPPPLSSETPDLNVVETRHPIFRELLLGRNPVVRLVKVDRYLQPSDDWSPATDKDAVVVAELHNGDPLVIEKRFGRGRAVAVLSTYAPLWNDMVLGPNVLLALKLQAYLAETRGQREERLVGQPLEVQLKSPAETPEVEFVVPPIQTGPPRVLERTADAGETAEELIARLAPPDSGETETELPGVYETWTTLADASRRVRRYAYNVDVDESDLTTVTPQDLSTVLDPVPFEYRSADDLGAPLAGGRGFNPSVWVMAVLVLMLGVEQILAYANTYHPARGGAA